MIWIGWHGEDLRDSLSDYAIHDISVFTTGKHKWSDKNAFFTVFDNRAKIELGSLDGLVQKVIFDWVSDRICTNSYSLDTLGHFDAVENPAGSSSVYMRVVFC